jgi:LPXTG-motif cell wall-anchored protein
VQLPNQGNPDQQNTSNQQNNTNQQDNSSQQNTSNQQANSNQTTGRGGGSVNVVNNNNQARGENKGRSTNTSHIKQKREDSCDSSIGNYIWYDTNGNGIQEDIEEGVSGIKVCAYNGNKKYCDTTDKHGHYKIKDLCLGRYTVVVKDVGEMIQTYDPDGSKDNKTRVKLKEDDKHTKADFGYRGRAPKTGNATNVVVLLILSTLATIGLIFLMRKKGII